MNVESRDYCSNRSCPLHTDCEMESYRTSTTYLSLTITDAGSHINIAIPCLMCTHAKKLDFGNIMRKAVTKAMLKGKNPIIGE